MLDDTTPVQLGQVLELNLDTGHKASIATRVKASPQMYTGAFKSKAPRLAATAPEYFAGGRNALKNPGAAFRGPTYRHIASPWMPITDPSRQHSPFRSATDRMARSPTMYRSGMHPGMQTAQGEYMLAASSEGIDSNHWKRLGFFESHGARLSPPPRRETEGVKEDSDAVYKHKTVSNGVDSSPQRMSVMRSTAERGTTVPDPPYSTSLGPGSYDYEPTSELHKSKQPTPSMHSRRPRFKKPSKEAHKTTLGGGVSAEIEGRDAWDRSAFLPQGHSGRSVTGPQLGSYEGVSEGAGRDEGLGRATSTYLRSPDITYQITNSPQKRNLVDAVSAAPRKYTNSFKSKEERLEKSWTETLSLSMPEAGVDPLDLSASAASGFSKLSMADDLAGNQRALSSFKSETQRFGAVGTLSKGPDGVWLDQDKKAWSKDLKQPLTSKSPYKTFIDSAKKEAPGPGTYVSSPVWTKEQWQRDPSPQTTRRLFSSSPAYR